MHKLTLFNMLKCKRGEDEEESSENNLLQHEDVSLELEEVITSGKDNLNSISSSQCETGSPSKVEVQVQVHCDGHTQDPGLAKNSTLESNKRNERFQRGLDTKLLDAIKRKDDQEVQSLLEQGADPNAVCHDGCISACHLAALAGGEALSLLHARHAKLMCYDLFGRTPLHFAAWEGNIAQVALLLDIPKDIRVKIKHPLSQDVLEEIRANNSQFQDLANKRCMLGEVTSEHLEELEEIIGRHRFSKDLPVILMGWTPLHAASVNARDECVRLLLAAGSDPNARDDKGRSPLDVVGFMHYCGREINPNEFANVIHQLLETNPASSNNEIKLSHTPLHTAVEVESIEAITDLLAFGASVCSQNQDGLTPLHLCVMKKLKKHLQIFVKNDKHNALVTTVDLVGRTILHTAVLSNWSTGVCIALAEGADPLALAHDGESPFHLAAALGNLNIVNEILSVVDIKNNINIKNMHSQTPLFKAVDNGHTNCVIKLLKCGASITVTTGQGMNVLHVAAKRGYHDILNILLDHNDADTKELIDSQIENCKQKFGPIHFAVWHNHPECVKLLLTKNASVLMNSSGVNMVITPLHLAALKNNVEIAKILIEFNAATIHEVDYFGFTPLHAASYCASRKVVIFLLKQGANLAAITREKKVITKTSVDMIMKNMSQPTDFMEEVFDSCIHGNDLNLHDSNCKVTVDYSILLPDFGDKFLADIESKTYKIEQMSVIEAIIGSGNRQNQNRLLLHPLIQSFLWLKWRALSPFFYCMIIVYIWFAISFTGFLLSTLLANHTNLTTPYTSNDNNTNSTSFNTSNVNDANGIISYTPTSNIWFQILRWPLILLVIQEIFHYKYSKKYVTQLESWLKLCLIYLIIYLISYNKSSSDTITYRNAAAIAMLLSWIQLMFFLSGSPTYGYYVPMFRMVSLNMVKVLLTFGFLIIGFSLSFMIVFHAEEPFENPFAAIIKTMVMMTSEFDYENLMGKIKENEGLTPFLIPVRVVFVGFLIFTAIVLMNLMVGVAVNDLQNLEFLGNIGKTEKQVEFLSFLENVKNFLRCNRLIAYCFPITKKTVKKSIILGTNELSCKYFNKLPSHLRDSIFDIALRHKRQRDELLGSKTYNTKLDEIYKVIVKNSKQDELCSSPEPMEEEGQNKNQHIKEEINATQSIESLITELKLHLDSRFKQNQNSIELLNIKIDNILNKLNM
ncbi:transient receptor potential channel pyrexia isoform X1 [Manduca sexta]|uniref:TRPA5-3 n=1 Tax=Manduca sexta TaxID=7130 RepID=A0A517BE58_MANSE|nr:transient receptor potential channel pyrexia isoform X1 [Manduca sexta]KAG6453880.1 hypothetical protein O3G_MSEX008371 [Manduca sexta]KAG6453881.1 hypothetical protein O3G_MSEX008371 [Manduca sexta]QDR51045.1 TRPA5-3 [Manduca sexta]